MSVLLPDSEIVIIKRFMGYEIWNDELELANVPIECESFNKRINSKLEH
jgi:hypothetical protein